jgi:(p)ppGpp synthase/HD superfamily hydrolase
MNTQIQKAKDFAQLVHINHFRRDGVTPYFNHLEAVVDNLEILLGDRKAEFKIEYDSMICAAWLHDSVEDERTTIDIIHKEFGTEVANYVMNLTHEDGELYIEYIQHLASNYTCRLIKVADILSNLSDSPTQHQIIKYTNALKLLVK